MAGAAPATFVSIDRTESSGKTRFPSPVMTPQTERPFWAPGMHREPPKAVEEGTCRFIRALIVLSKVKVLRM